MIKAIIFDLDNTLLDRETSLIFFIKSQYNKFQEELGHINIENYSSTFIKLDANGMAWKDIVYKQMLIELKIANLEWQTLLDDYVTNFCNHCVSYEGVKSALDALKTKNYKLGIITNGKYPFQQKNIEALGIENYFSTIIVSEKAGIKKPQAEIFYLSAKQLGIESSQAIYIGDNPRIDIEAAQNAGMKAIWKRNNNYDDYQYADAIFDEFNTLPEIIEKL